MEFLDKSGVTYLWNKIKQYVTNGLNTKVDIEQGKGLSANDFTDELKQKLVDSHAYELPVAGYDVLGGVKVNGTYDALMTNLTYYGIVIDTNTQRITAAVPYATVSDESYNSGVVTISPSGGLVFKEGTKSSVAVNVGTGLKIENNKVVVESAPTATEVDWSGILNKPQLALKSDITGIYTYKGSLTNLAAIEAVAEKSVGDVYNSEETGMNYAWTGTEWDGLGMALQVEAISTEEIDEIISGLSN